jgi:hypothetical protein
MSEKAADSSRQCREKSMIPNIPIYNEDAKWRWIGEAIAVQTPDPRYGEDAVR